MKINLFVENEKNDQKKSLYRFTIRWDALTLLYLVVDFPLSPLYKAC